MGFVNEYVPDEDIEKYDLRGIWDKYYPLYKGEFYFGNKPHWTVDRESNAFLTTIEPGRSGRGSRKRFLFWLDGKHIVVELALAPGSSGDLDADPFIRIWDLIQTNIPDADENEKAKVMRLLKDALSAYGYRGVTDQRPNTVVKFKF